MMRIIFFSIFIIILIIVGVEIFSGTRKRNLKILKSFIEAEKGEIESRIKEVIIKLGKIVLENGFSLNETGEVFQNWAKINMGKKPFSVYTAKEVFSRMKKILSDSDLNKLIVYAEILLDKFQKYSNVVYGSRKELREAGKELERNISSWEFISSELDKKIKEE